MNGHIAIGNDARIAIAFSCLLLSTLARIRPFCQLFIEYRINHDLWTFGHCTWKLCALNSKHIPYVIFIWLNVTLNMNNYNTCCHNFFSLNFFFAMLSFRQMKIVCKISMAMKCCWYIFVVSFVFCFRILQSFLWCAEQRHVIFCFVCAGCLFLLLRLEWLGCVVGVILCMCNDRTRIYVFYDSGEIIK